MPRIVICTFGSFGETYPFIAIGVELRARGHEVVIATGNEYKEAVLKCGLAYHLVRPNGPDIDREKTQSVQEGEWSMASLLQKAIMPHLRESYEDTLAIARDCDLLISRPLTPAARIAARVLGKKWMGAALTPLSLWSIYDPPVAPSFCAPRRLKYLRGHPLVQRYHRYKIRRHIALWSQQETALSNELGLRPEPCNLVNWTSSYGNLALFSRALMQPQKDWPRPMRVCGPCFPVDAKLIPLPVHVREFLEKGEAPLLFTLGTSSINNPDVFWKESERACRLLGCRGILATGGANRARKELACDNQVAAFDYVPFESLMPYIKAAVFPGGIGTATLLLQAGKPSLIIPSIFDQYDNAGRIEKLGAARTLSREAYEANRVASELKILLSDPQYRRRAGEIAEIISKENGPVTAADEIEKVLAAA